MVKNFSNLSDSEIVKLDKDSIYLGNLFTVELNLDLPKQGKMGSTITWVSHSERFLKSDGKINRPEYGMGNRTVKLVATIEYGSASDTREFDVTILERERPNVIISIRDVQVTTSIGVAPELPGIVITINDDDTFSTSAVVWDKIDSSKYAQTGSFTVEGKVDKCDIKAKAVVNVTDAPMAAKSYKAAVAAAVPFALSQVSLFRSLFTENRDRHHEFLLSQDLDSMLYNFRDAADLDTKNAQPMLGWDAPDCNLKGHTTGHFMSALAQAYASTGDEEFKKRIDYMITELGKCQDAMAASGKFKPGFLSGYSEEQFDKLEEFTTYPNIWAPYYTLHKIFAGLLDCYELAENKQALEIADKLGHWVYNRLSRLSREHLNKMWAMYIAGEYGGMNDVLSRLYGITGKEEFLTAAKYFDNDHLFIPAYENVDTLGGIHANQHIPAIVGALKTYEVAGEDYYYHVSRNFWKAVVGHHIYNIGGTGSGEMFKPRDMIAKYLNDRTAETCATYNMLKLTRGLFAFEPEAEYMDYYEKAMYNHIAPSQDHSAPNGGSTYFMPLRPGATKRFDTTGNTCCHGTGLENHTKYQDTIYFHSADNSALYVNLYIPSVLTWKEKGFVVTQTGDYLTDNAVSLTIEGSGKLDIKLRVPYWVEKGFNVKINGEEQSIEAKPGSYVTLSRDWANGDRIDIDMPFTFRIEPAPDDKSVVSIFYGPLTLAGIKEDDSFIEIDLGGKHISEVIKPTDNPLVFDLNGIELIPHNDIEEKPYHAYFKLKQ